MSRTNSRISPRSSIGWETPCNLRLADDGVTIIITPCQTDDGEVTAENCRNLTGDGQVPDGCRTGDGRVPDR